MTYNPHIGANQAICFSVESSNGVKNIAKQFWIPKTDGSLNPDNTYSNEESGLGTIVTLNDSRLTKSASGLAFGAVMGTNTIGVLLLGVFGEVNSVANPDLSGNVYDHTYTIEEGNTHKSFTVYSLDNVTSADGEIDYATYMKIDTLEINVAPGDYVRYTANLQGQGIKSEAFAGSVSFASEAKFSFDDVSVKVVSAIDEASAITALGLAPKFRIQDFRISFGKNLLQSQELGSLDIADIFNQNFTIEGDFTAVYGDKDIYDVFNSSGKKYLEVTMKNTNATIGTAENPELRFLINQASFQSWSKSTDVNAIITQTIGFVGEFNSTDGKAMTGYLTNTVSSY